MRASGIYHVDLQNKNLGRIWGTRNVHAKNKEVNQEVSHTVNLGLESLNVSVKRAPAN